MNITIKQYKNEIRSLKLNQYQINSEAIRLVNPRKTKGINVY